MQKIQCHTAIMAEDKKEVSDEYKTSNLIGNLIVHLTT